MCKVIYRNIFSIVFVLVLIITICGAQVIQFGTCADVETMKYFDVERFQGTWYEIQRFPTWYEDYGQCAYKTFDYCGREMEIGHGFIRDGVEFVLHLNSTYSPGDEAIFHIAKNNIDPLGIPLSVIKTDYTNYAILYGCRSNEELDIKYILAWILSRERTLESDLLSEAQLILNSLPSADAAYLQTVEQSEEKCSFHWTAHVQATYNEDAVDEDNLLY
ncbi:hypothetical protein K1T71_010652 [Dendrolimus kikuchii]|uniref:Uncharacterized protein n=1 Tax=Dendrolimus kikuchii TaxID=765133 RepID=A0ACC1CPQ3_9NEOP|nr:hypothetical protein K1T71_010652 [Dendrolimus kikuchii]